MKGKHVQVQAHAYSQAASLSLKRVLFVPCPSLKCRGQAAQDTSLQASAEALLVPQLDGEVFCLVFVVTAKQYPYHISGLSQSAFHTLGNFLC